MKQFETISIKRPKKSVFDLSHSKVMTIKFGDIVPIMIEETIPGDIFKSRQELVLRMHPMLAPLMHRINVDVLHFFVPYRLVWDGFEEFITGGVDGTNEAKVPMVTVNSGQTIPIASLSDYMGLPTGTGKAYKFSSLPFRAYQLIWNNYFRDQNLQPEITVPKNSIDTPWNAVTPWQQMRIRNYEKDYFTSALPFAQRGEPVSLPLGQFAPVESDGNIQFGSNDSTPLSGPTALVNSVPPNPWSKLVDSSANKTVDQVRGLRANLSSATAATITDLRRAFALQRWLEKSARGGARYTELLQYQFAEHNKDSRLQRPQFLGGGRLPIKIGEVLQTSETTPESPLGQYSGHGSAMGNVSSFRQKFSEHGVVLSLMCVMPRTGYFQGVPRQFMKRDRFEFPWPDFAHIGDQPVYNAEVNPAASESDNMRAFGYQRRYAEYTTRLDSCHGEMRSTLDFWHMMRKFSGTPNLNSAFVEYDPSTERIFPVDSTAKADKIILQMYNNFSAVRPLPRFGNPL